MSCLATTNRPFQTAVSPLSFTLYCLTPLYEPFKHCCFMHQWLEIVLLFLFLFMIILVIWKIINSARIFDTNTNYPSHPNVNQRRWFLFLNILEFILTLPFCSLSYADNWLSSIIYYTQGLVKGAKLFLNPYFFGWLVKWVGCTVSYFCAVLKAQFSGLSN